MASVTLPAEMMYFPPSVAARARSYRQTVTPMNASTFNPSDKIKLVLGTTPGTYLNTMQTYIEFDINGTTGLDDTTLGIDRHAASFIERLEVYHAGALIDTINQVGVLYNTLLDASVSFADQQTAHVMGGVEDYDPANEAFRVGREIVPVAATSGKTHVAFTLLGLLGPASLNRYLPLGDAVNGNIELHIYLAPVARPVIATGGASQTGAWTINNVELQTQLVEVDAAVHSALIASTGGVYSLPYNSWRHYGYNIASGATSETLYISTKVSSMSGVIVQMRPQASVNDIADESVGWRTRNGLTSIQLRVGALNFPLKPLTTTDTNLEQAMIESYKMFGKLGSAMGGTGLTRGSYAEEGFFVAFDTQAYSAASAAVDDGLQAQHGSTYLQLEFTGGATAACVVDVHVLFDGMLTVANGAISAAF